MSEKINIALKMIVARIQTRAETNEETVAEYAEAMKAGAMFPPVAVFEVASGDYVLADGLHRIAAVERNGGKSIEAEVRPGTEADALKFALKANVTNGLRRTNADKRRAVEMAVKEFGNMSSREIADLCAVSHTFVETVRVGNGCQLPQTLNSTPGTEAPLPPVKRTGRDGKQYTAKREASKPAAKSAFPAEPHVRTKAMDEEIADIKRAQAQASTTTKIIFSDGLQFAKMAISQIERINKNDTQREEGYDIILNTISDLRQKFHNKKVGCHDQPAIFNLKRIWYHTTKEQRELFKTFINETVIESTPS